MNERPWNEPDGAISLKPAMSADHGFLRRVYAATREPERRASTWTDDEWSEFVDSQFEAQRRHYLSAYPGAEHSIILHRDVPAGRLWVWESETQIRLLDIAILPEHRNLGIGTHLIRALQDRASHTAKPLRHMVELNNPGAMRLYERLGFVPIETRGLHVHLEWLPPGFMGSTEP